MRVERLPDVAAVFRSTAEGETGHAHGHLEFLQEVGDPCTNQPIGNTVENLNSAIIGAPPLPACHVLSLSLSLSLSARRNCILSRQTPQLPPSRRSEIAIHLPSFPPCSLAPSAMRGPQACTTDQSGSIQKHQALNTGPKKLGETHEYTEMYPGMAKTARDEGFEDVADW